MGSSSLGKANRKQNIKILIQIMQSFVRNIKPSLLTRSKMKHFISVIILIVTAHTSAQTRNNDFRNFEIVLYKIGANNKVDIANQVIINDNSIVEIYRNDSERKKGINCYSKKIDSITLTELKKIFTGQTPLKQNFITKELKKGRRYAGSYYYASYTSNTFTDQLCFVPPYMSSDFQRLLREIENILFGKSDRISSKCDIDLEMLERKISKQHKVSSYLPKIEEPFVQGN